MLLFQTSACFAEQHSQKRKEKIKALVQHPASPNPPNASHVSVISDSQTNSPSIWLFHAVWRLTALACDTSGAYSISPPRRPTERPRLVLWTCQYYEVPSPDLTGLRVGGRALTFCRERANARARTSFPSISSYCFNKTLLPATAYVTGNLSGYILFWFPTGSLFPLWRRHRLPIITTKPKSGI